MLKKQLKIIKNHIHGDNYANESYEIICSYIKMITLMIEERLEGKENSYRVIMCPPKTAGVDSYIVCTSNNGKDIALQIKSGHWLQHSAKCALKHVVSKRGLPVCKSYIITWDKPDVSSVYDCKDVYNEDILDLLDFLEREKCHFPKYYDFIVALLENAIEEIEYQLPLLPIFADDLQNEYIFQCESVCEKAEKQTEVKKYYYKTRS